MKLKNRLRLNYINIRGWSNKNKVLVIESDDWGSVRTSSPKALASLKKLGVLVQKCHYTMFDALASEDDLDSLFSVLSGVKDRRGNHACLTANSLVANPDFKKIQDDNFQNYYWEDFKNSLNRYTNHSKSFDLWKDGMARGVFHPQFHGREHLNISRWMKSLQDNDQITKLAFELGICSVSGHIVPNSRGSHLAAFDGGKCEVSFNKTEIVKDGLQKFADIFGYQSLSMIAPNYVWDDEIEQAAHHEGVKYIQGSTKQRVAKDFNMKQKVIRHYTGEKNILGQQYLVRNCHFEPASNPNKDWVDSCLSEIKIAFTMRKPAIISTHRVNFIGYIDPKNRDKNLPQLKELLSQIVKKWPDVVFMTSDQLGNYMNNKIII
jgi:hypothetical protein